MREKVGDCAPERRDGGEKLGEMVEVAISSLCIVLRWRTSRMVRDEGSDRGLSLSGGNYHVVFTRTRKIDTQGEGERVPWVEMRIF